jgi:NAD(P)-dependent dehydrogenase (short-subunit alcohol dehydrogenase family)
VTDRESVRGIADACRIAGLRWDVFIGSVGTEEPIGPFFECDFDAWEWSVHANALGVLRVLHALYPLRTSGRECACVLFTGAGTNNAAVNYSAYSASKIFLMKMTELLAAENAELNAVIIGPGIVRTKIHEQTIRAGKRSGSNYDRVVRFLESGDAGVSHDDVYACVNWCIRAGRAVAGGRNFSLVHDAWRDEGRALREALVADPDMYRLRRIGNSWEAFYG